METWSPDFSSSGQPNPTWTHVRFRGGVLANALEWIEWADNPVQVILCEACGIENCAPKRVEKLPAMLRHRLTGCDTLTPETACLTAIRSPATQEFGACLN